MPCYAPPDGDEYFEIERQVIASMFNVLNELQSRGYDPSQTITTFLANLAADQPNPLNVLNKLFAIAREKTITLKDMERGKAVRPLPNGAYGVKISRNRSSHQDPI